MTREEKLEHVVKLGVQMRTAQKLYFKDRTRERLVASKQQEAGFDRAVADLDLPANLFGGG